MIQFFLILDFDRNNLFLFFTFLFLWTFDFERKKRFADFLLGHWSTKINWQIFKKYWKNTIQESCTKKGTILHQAPQITLFFDSPCTILIYTYNYHLCIQFLFKHTILFYPYNSNSYIQFIFKHTILIYPYNSYSYIQFLSNHTMLI